MKAVAVMRRIAPPPNLEFSIWGVDSGWVADSDMVVIANAEMLGIAEREREERRFIIDIAVRDALSSTVPVRECWLEAGRDGLGERMYVVRVGTEIGRFTYNARYCAITRGHNNVRIVAVSTNVGKVFPLVMYVGDTPALLIAQVVGLPLAAVNIGPLPYGDNPLWDEQRKRHRYPAQHMA